MQIRLFTFKIWLTLYLTLCINAIVSFFNTWSQVTIVKRIADTFATHSLDTVDNAETIKGTTQTWWDGHIYEAHRYKTLTEMLSQLLYAENKRHSYNQNLTLEQLYQTLSMCIHQSHTYSGLFLLELGL